MTVYIQGMSALAYYRNGGAATEVERTSASVRSLEDATSSRTEILDAGIWSLGIGEPTEERPLEVLVCRADQRTRSNAIHARVWSGPIVPTSFRRIRKDLYVSSPEFVFLQLATMLDLPNLVALGMELCGTYRRNVELPTIDGSGITLSTAYQQPALSNPRRLRGFVVSMKSAPGRPRALKALDYVLANSASPMETALYLLLCLPRKMGGYALPKPILNPPIVFSKSGRKHTLRNSAKPDLYWRAARLDLEYDSDEFHDESTRAASSMRRKALERMKVEVVGLTPDELLAADLLHATAMRIARRLKRRLRPEGEGDFLLKRAALRQSLLYDDPTAPPHLLDEKTKEQAAGQSGMQEADLAAEAVYDTIWLGEAPEADLWPFESCDETWDGADLWDVDFVEADDSDLNVFGRGEPRAE